jgi:fatty acid-binding protein DegV
VRLAGYAGDEIDLEEAQDLAAEMVVSGRIVGEGGKLVASGRLRPFVEWAGGEYVAAARAAENAAQMEAMF